MRHDSAALFAGVVLLLCAVPGRATVQRTFVSRSGLDSNPCSIDQPCRSFAAAILLTSANGEIVVNDSAGYGPVTITKAVAIIAPLGVHAGISVFSADGVAVNAGASDAVVLRNLYINSQGGANGITLGSAAALHIEHCVVSGFAGNGISLLPTVATSTAAISDTVVREVGSAGIYAGPIIGTMSLAVDRTLVDDSPYGVVIDMGVDLAMRDSRVFKTGVVGIWARGSSTGIGTPHVWVDGSVSAQSAGSGFYATGGDMTVSNSLSAGNSDGFRAENTGRQIALHHCVASDNTNGFLIVFGAIMTVSDSMATRNASDGIAAIGAGSVFISGNTVTNNAVGLHVTGAATMQSIGNNMVRGNATDISGSVGPVTAN